MTRRKPKPADFVGQLEVLGYLSEGEVETHHGIAAFLGAPTQAVAIVLRRQVRLGRVACLRRSGRGRYAQPGLFQITEQGRRFFESGRQESRERGARSGERGVESGEQGEARMNTNDIRDRLGPCRCGPAPRP